MHCSVGPVHRSHDPQVLYLEKKIKNGSHGTIHSFKNYFATVYLFIYNFQQNKQYPNGSLVYFPHLSFHFHCSKHNINILG